MPTRDTPNLAGSFPGRVGALVLHTLFVYFCAVHVSPWLVSRWFAWIAPMLQISVSVPASDWYLQHLELATIFPAFIFGYFSILSVSVASFHTTLARINKTQDVGRNVPVAMWAWTIPTFILCYKMLVHRASGSSVLNDGGLMPTIRYFFVIQQEGPRIVGKFISGDPVRVVTQMFVTAPFYAGIAYSLGALAAKYDLLSKLFSFQTSQHPESDMTDQ